METINENELNLKTAFWKWYYSHYCEEIANKDADIEFQENNYDEILNKLGEVIGLIF